MFEKFRNEPIKLLEIGVLEGKSLKMWEEYFPNARLVFLDIDEKCLQYATDRSIVELGDQGDAKFLQRIASQYGPFDIILDGGSHKWPHQILGVVELLNFARPGGYYVIEDLQCHYYPMNAAEGTELSSVTFLKELVTEEVIFHDPYAVANVDMIEQKTGQKYIIESITFMKDICFIERR